MKSVPAFCVYAAIIVGTVVDAKSWGIPGESSPDLLPNIEVRLAPPVKPLPQVSAAIATLEKSRHAQEEEQFATLNGVFNAVLEEASKRIDKAIARSMRATKRAREHSLSFLELRERESNTLAADFPRVRIAVLPAAPPDPARKVDIENLERSRAGAELRMFEQAIAELRALGDIVVSEFENSFKVASHAKNVRGDQSTKGEIATSLLMVGKGRGGVDEHGQPSPHVNVRVGSSDVPYPTLTSMVSDMESRRDAEEDLARERILELEMKLLTSLNAIADHRLRSALAGNQEAGAI